MTKQSFNSLQNKSKMYERMFPDSAIAKKITCGPTKVGYMVSFALGPYFN